MKIGIPWALLGYLFVSTSLFATENELSILLYHRFDEPGYPSTNTSGEELRQHLDYLTENHYKILSLKDVVTAWQNKAKLPDKAVVITIDDAYRSVYESAWPILRQYQAPFTLFVSTAYVAPSTEGYMSWEQLKQLASAGVTLGNHSHNHGHLIEKQGGESRQAWRQRIKDEVTQAQALLAMHTGQDNPWFAYPYGEYSDELAGLLNQLGYLGFGQQSGPAGSQSDQRALPRFPVSGRFGDLAQLPVKVAARVMPVVSVSTRDPLLSPEQVPVLTVELAEGVTFQKQLRCYNANGEAITIEWDTRHARRFTARATKALTQRRERFNCTAPTSVTGSWYWYSQPWINPRWPEY